MLILSLLVYIHAPSKSFVLLLQLSIESQEASLERSLNTCHRKQIWSTTEFKNCIHISIHRENCRWELILANKYHLYRKHHAGIDAGSSLMLGVAGENSYLARSQGSAGKQHLVPGPGQEKGNVHRGIFSSVMTWAIWKVIDEVVSSVPLISWRLMNITDLDWTLSEPWY